MTLSVYSLAYPVTALGPGLRAALWLAGCGRDCPGCVSPEMQDPEAGRRVNPVRLADRVLKLDRPITGLTVSGGEPLDQAPALSLFLKEIHRARLELNVILFTGYTLADIMEGPPEPRRLLMLVDVLIDGPYKREIPAVHPMAGSGNQVIHYLSPAGRALKPEMDEMTKARYDLGLGPGGLNLLVGVGGPLERLAVKNSLGLGNHDHLEEN